MGALGWLVFGFVATALQVGIPAGELECLHVYGTPGNRVVISYELLRPTDGQLVVTVQRSDAENKWRAIPSHPPSKVGQLKLTDHITAPTKFLVCFKSTRVFAEGVDLMLDVDSDPAEQNLNVATVTHTNDLLAAVKLLRADAHDLYTQQSFKIGRWGAYTTALISSHRRLKFWRVWQALGVATFVIVHIFFVRHIFTKKTHLLG